MFTITGYCSKLIVHPNTNTACIKVMKGEFNKYRKEFTTEQDTFNNFKREVYNETTSYKIWVEVDDSFTPENFGYDNKRVIATVKVTRANYTKADGTPASGAALKAKLQYYPKGTPGIPLPIADQMMRDLRAERDQEQLARDAERVAAASTA